MRLSELGELGLIEGIRQSIKNSAAVLKGIGDDCAVVKFNKRLFMLLTCDMLVQGVDFKPEVNPYLLGRKAIACSISDIAAKGGLPRYALVSLGIPRSKSYGYLKRLYKGLNHWAEKFNIDIVGGDISRSEKLVIDISMVGLVEKNKLVLRRGTKLNDIIFVTGKIGSSSLGKHLSFKPRLKEARFLVENFKVNSMINVSDGLVLDLSRILKENRLGAIIFEGLIPKQRQDSRLKDVLYQGEDFELLFTLSVKEAKRLIAHKDKLYSPIGQITEEDCGLKLIDRSCRVRPLEPRGYCHF